MGNKHHVREIEGGGEEYVRGLEILSLFADFLRCNRRRETASSHFGIQSAFCFYTCSFSRAGRIVEGGQQTVITAFNMSIDPATTNQLTNLDLSQDKKTFFLTTRAIAPSFLSDYSPAPPTQSSFPP